MLGPIDYIVVGFRGNNFDGSILDELSAAVKSGVIRVIDLVFVVKGEDGSVIGGEFEDQPDELKEMLSEIRDRETQPMLSEEDIEQIAEKMDNDTAAGILVIEHLWAKGLKRAIIDAGGELIDEGRIHPEIVAGVVEELELEDQEQHSKQTDKQSQKSQS